MKIFIQAAIASALFMFVLMAVANIFIPQFDRNAPERAGPAAP